MSLFGEERYHCVREDKIVEITRPRARMGCYANEPSSLGVGRPLLVPRSPIVSGDMIQRPLTQVPYSLRRYDTKANSLVTLY